MIELSAATDRSTYAVRVTVSDELGEPTAPVTLKWTLLDGKNKIINNRKDIPIIPPTTVMHIVLSADDIEYRASNSYAENNRHLVVEGTYNSALTGTVMPIREGFKFSLLDLPEEAVSSI